MTASQPNHERIRVAFVITELNVGGAERCLTQIATGLDRNRFTPMVISIAPRPADDQAALVNSLEEAQVPVYFLNASSKWHLPLAVRRLRRALFGFAPDVVQSFLFHADVLTRLAGRGKTRRVYQGLRVADPAAGRQRCQRWAARRADAVVCVSKAVRTYARDVVKIEAEKLVVIPNAVDVDHQSAVTPVDLQTIGVAASRRVILFVGRLHRQKGVDWLLEAMPEVCQLLPQHDLVLVGAGDDERLLRTQARNLKVGDRIHFVGWRGDVPRFMAASSQLVLPSRWEGMPNVVLEAMAAGLPVVATDTQGVRELLADQGSTQTVEFGDTRALVERLVAFGRDADLAHRVGAANQARAATCFSLPQMIEAYQSLYESPDRAAAQTVR